MRILIGCERSGVIRRAFKALGHEVHSVDLSPSEDGADGYDGIGKNIGCHHVGDVFEVLSSWPHVFDPLGRWDLFIVHPECRYLSSSGLHWNHRRPERERERRRPQLNLRCAAGRKARSTQRACVSRIPAAAWAPCCARGSA